MTQRTDPRIQALRRFAVSITVFTILGHVWLGFEQAYLTPVAALLTAYTLSLFLEALDSWARHVRPRFASSFMDLVNFLLPAHIAALACAMLLYGNENLMPTIFAVAVAVSGKYIIRVPVNGRMRHVLNPSNLGITVTLLCFTWVSIAPPYHFTENTGSIVDWVIPAAVLVSGTVLNAKLTRRMPLIGGWLAGFVAQAVIRGLFLDDSIRSTLLVVVGVAFVLFTNYMITDPGTTPAEPRAQVVFGVATGLVYGALVVAHVAFGLFFALTIVCCGRLVLIVAQQSWRAAQVSRRTAPALPVAQVPQREPVAGR